MMPHSRKKADARPRARCTVPLVDSAVRKYLAGHEAAEAKLALPLVQRERSWAHVLVVPAHGERMDFLEGYRAAASAAKGHVLLLVVLNGRRGDPEEMRARDLECHRHCFEGGDTEILEFEGARASLRIDDAFDLLVVDRVSPGRCLAEGEGVGTARKIGSDLALALWAMGAIRRAWIHGSDADVSLPRDYFEGRATDRKVLASLAPFAHAESGDAALDAATWRYEARLRWYVQGLAWAGSPFAHHSIGSTISVRPEAYARVRGFPRRQAGEDFYLLDKLAKLGRGAIERKSGAPLFIRPRASRRVPFGTGPAVAAALEGAPIEFYDPAVFEALQRVLGALGSVARSGELEALLRVADESALGEALRARGWLERAQQLVGSYPSSQLAARFRDAFDGLSTLRLVHALRDRRWPSDSLEALWERAEFLGPRRHGIESLEARLDYMRRREGIGLGL